MQSQKAQTKSYSRKIPENQSIVYNFSKIEKFTPSSHGQKCSFSTTWKEYKAKRIKDNQKALIDVKLKNPTLAEVWEPNIEQINAIRSMHYKRNNSIIKQFPCLNTYYWNSFEKSWWCLNIWFVKPNQWCNFCCCWCSMWSWKYIWHFWWKLIWKTREILSKNTQILFSE